MFHRVLISSCLIYTPPLTDTFITDVIVDAFNVLFLQGVSIACYAEPCISHGRDVRPSVSLSVCLSHAGTEWKRRKLGLCRFTNYKPRSVSIFLCYLKFFLCFVDCLQKDTKDTKKDVKKEEAKKKESSSSEESSEEESSDEEDAKTAKKTEEKKEVKKVRRSIQFLSEIIAFCSKNTQDVLYIYVKFCHYLKKLWIYQRWANPKSIWIINLEHSYIKSLITLLVRILNSSSKRKIKFQTWIRYWILFRKFKKSQSNRRFVSTFYLYEMAW